VREFTLIDCPGIASTEANGNDDDVVEAIAKDLARAEVSNTFCKKRPSSQSIPPERIGYRNSSRSKIQYPI
jgi:hypothetical protein